MGGISVSASEVMMREQLDRIIARSELHVEQHCVQAISLAPNGDQAKRARVQLAQMLTGLAKLKAYRNEFSEPQARTTSRPAVRWLAKQVRRQPPEAAMALRDCIPLAVTQPPI
jgi:hypothetical protein